MSFTSHTFIHKVIWASHRDVDCCSRQWGLPFKHPWRAGLCRDLEPCREKLLNRTARSEGSPPPPQPLTFSQQLTSPEGPQPAIAGLVLQCQNVISLKIHTQKLLLGITDICDVTCGKSFSARILIFFFVFPLPSWTYLLCESHRLVLRPVATCGSHQSPCPTAP